MEVKTLNVSDEWKTVFRSKTIVNVLEDKARNVPKAEALVFGKQKITYKEYQEKVTLFAKGLYSIGVRKGDHVALWITNRPEWCYVRLAVNKLGAVVIPVNTRYGAEDLEYILNQSGSSTLVMEPSFLGKIDSINRFKEVCPELENYAPGKLSCAKLPLLKNVACFDIKVKGCFSMEELFLKTTKVSERDINVSVSPDDTIHITYTSGTTGFPKGVVIPSSVHMSLMPILAEIDDIHQNDRYLLVTPFFGNIGLSISSMCHYAGAALVSGSQFSTQDILETIQKEKITYSILVPTLLADIVSHPEIGKYDFSSLKHIASGGALLPSSLIGRVKELTGVTITNEYGLSEAGGITTRVPQNDTEEHISKTVGLPLPNAEVAVLDPNSGKPLPSGEEGEICTREVLPGSKHMKGYYKKPELTAETIKEGWLYSGDLGKMDEDGYLYITGRVKEMFIVGGFKVSPAEVEQYLSRHPKIHSVAVAGVPDKRLGEVACAFVKLKEGQSATESEIIDYCQGKIANIKVPRYVIFVDQFPLNVQGKVQRFKLMEKATKELALEELK